MTTLLRLDAVGYRYPSIGKGVYRALQNVNLTVAEGEIVCLVGNSGSGKSTLIQLIAGLLMPTDGGIVFAGREVAGPGPDRAMVGNDNTLLPWLTCEGNVMLAVEQVFGREESRGQLRARSLRALTRVALHDVAKRLPGELSAGMRQRLELARALAMEPRALLLDDPLAALDLPTRRHLRKLLRRQARENGMAVVLATSDIDDALETADRIALLTDGPDATIRETLAAAHAAGNTGQGQASVEFREHVLTFLQAARLQ